MSVLDWEVGRYPNSGLEILRSLGLSLSNQLGYPQTLGNHIEIISALHHVLLTFLVEQS